MAEINPSLRHKIKGQQKLALLLFWAGTLNKTEKSATLRKVNLFSEKGAGERYRT